MSKLGVGVVGLGWVSGEHVKAFARNPHTEVVALCSRDLAKAREKAKAVGPACRAYDDYEKMLADPRVQIVSICTPHPLHAAQGIAGAQAGRHLVIEKPVALNVRDLKALRDAVRKAKVRSVVSFVLRWNPLFTILKRLLDEKAIGDLYYAEVDYLHGIGPWYPQHHWNHKKAWGGSSFLTAGCHAMDGVRWFVGGEAAEVCAYSNTSPKNPIGYEYPPNTVAIVKFRNGVIAKSASMVECVGPYVFPITLLGDQGTIRNNAVFSKKLFPGQTHFATIPTICPDSGDVTHHPFQGEIDHFVEGIRSRKGGHCDLEDAVKTHEICLAADLSAATGKPVKLPLLPK
jgi:predicted dehydrogenase